MNCHWYGMAHRRQCNKCSPPSLQSSHADHATLRSRYPSQASATIASVKLSLKESETYRDREFSDYFFFCPESPPWKRVLPLIEN